MVLASTKEQFEGKVFPDTTNHRANFASDEFIQRGNGMLDVAIPIFENGQKIGMVRMGFKNDRMNARIAESRYASIKQALIAIGIGAVLILLVDRQVKRTVTKLISVTRNIAAGNQTQAVEIHTGDALESLGDAFNQMANSISYTKSRCSIKEYHENIVKSITDGIVVLDCTPRITYWNHAMERITGTPAAQMTKRSPVEVSQYLKKQGLNEFLGRALKGELVERENVRSRREGDKVFTSEMWFPLRDAQGEIIGVIIRITDITEKSLLQRQLQAYTEQLEEILEERTRKLKASQAQLFHQEKMAGLGMLAAGIAHEIGNPLASISSVVQLMQRKAVNAFFGEKLDLVKTHIDRISHIVREVSSFARPANPERHYVQINDVVEASINLTRYDKRVKKDIQLATVLDPATPKTVVIEDQLLQVFMNLILNAADAMESGGKLTVTTRCRDDAIEICFSDTGIGIPSDVRPHIFDPFFTTKSVGKGMGLGLSVSHSMIKNMGGEIDVESHSGEGTTFTITLPVIASISEKETNDVWENLDRR